MRGEGGELAFGFRPAQTPAHGNESVLSRGGLSDRRIHRQPDESADEKNQPDPGPAACRVHDV